MGVVQEFSVFGVDKWEFGDLNRIITVANSVVDGFNEIDLGLVFFGDLLPTGSHH